MGARVALLLLAACAFMAALALARRDDRRSLSPYVCPMHPQFAALSPGECPICGMALEPAEPRETSASAADGSPAGAPAPMAISFAALASDATPFLSYAAAPIHRHALRGEPRVPAWVASGTLAAALLYQDEVDSLARDDRGSFSTMAEPSRRVGVRRAPDPPSPWDASTWIVYFHIDAATPSLRPGTLGFIELVGKPRDSLVVLSDAVLHSGEGPYVLALLPGRGAFGQQPIKTGKVSSGYTVVASGAGERDLVVGVNAFSLDAERVLRSSRHVENGTLP